jgi:hypothetical protein
MKVSKGYFGIESVPQRFFQFAVALVALFAAVQGSAVPYAYSPYAYASGPIGQYASVNYAAAPYQAVSYAAHVAAPSVYAHPTAYAYPGAYAHSAVVAAPAVYAAPAVVPVAKVAATYTAATRGAVHTAPLEGHVVSRANINVAPAPGTY